MTETDVSTPPPAQPGPRRSPWLVLILLLVLAALAGGGYGGWKLWKLRAETDDTLAAHDVLLRRLSRQLGDAQSEIESLRDKQGDLADSSRRNADAVGQLQSRADDTAQALARLDATVQGGRARAQLVAVEQLLLIANDRVQLAHDVRGAATALEFAQDRLGALAEPKLFEVRKAVSDERAALLALPQADTQAAALVLNSLIARVADLPQRSRAPHRLATTEEVFDDEAPGGSWLTRTVQSLKAMLRSVFVIRRTDKPVDRLLPAEQEVLVGQILLLKLETARTALLRDDTEAFRGAVSEAHGFLGDYYRVEDPSVLAARAELERLQNLDLSPPPPDLTRSLGLLRAYIDSLPR
jgi:uroporphyrin-3 C-methyltransferase